MSVLYWIVGFLPAATLGLLLLGSEGNGYQRVEAMVARAVYWALAIYVVSEILSLFQVLSTVALRAAWLSAFLICLVFFTSFAKDSRRLFTQVKLGVASIRNSGKMDKLSAALFAVLVLGSAILMLFSAPSFIDTLTYHLARVEHWLSNQALTHYSTAIPRQLQFAPFGSMLSLQSIGLAGNDYAVKVYQFMAYLGSGTLAAVVARQLGGGKLAAWMAAVFFLTIPVAVFQSSSAQNDLIVGFFLVAAMFTLLQILLSGMTTWRVLVLGILCGLAILTKGTAFIFGVGFAIFLAWQLMGKYRADAAKVSLTVLALVVAINAPHYLRNQSVTFEQGGPQSLGNVQLEAISATSVFSNLIRNTGSLMYSPLNMPNQMIFKTVRGLHQGLGLDDSDPRYSFGETRWGYGVEGKSGVIASAGLRESMAGYPAHVFVMVICIVVFVVGWRKYPAILKVYFLGGVVAIIMFSVLLKWQPWMTRLTLPGALLAAPFVGLVAAQAAALRTWIRPYGIGLLALALPLVFINPARPLFGIPGLDRPALLTAVDRYAAAYQWSDVFVDAVAGLQVLSKIGETEIGLIVRLDSIEYPLWVVYRRLIGQPVKFVHVCPDQRGGVSVGKPHVPTYALAYDVALTGDGYTCGTNSFRSIWQRGTVTLLKLN